MANACLSYFIVSLWIAVSFPQFTISHQNCRTVAPIYGYCLSEKYPHRKINSVSLERCIADCERNTDYCSALSYRRDICTIHAISDNLSYGDFIKDESCTFLENVLRPYSSFSHDCATEKSSCPCWCEKRHSNGTCEECGSRALGMHSREISDKQITGSESLKGYEPSEGRLGSTKGWLSSFASSKTYIQVSFSPKKKTLTHIASQGSPTVPCWVTKYQIEYSKDIGLAHWEVYSTDDSSPFIFQGNSNTARPVKNELPRPLIGITAIKLRANKWSAGCHNIAMRIELYGC